MTHLPPQNLAAEQSILGAILLDNRVLDRLVTLKSEAFYRASHRQIYSAMLELREKKEAIDIITLSERLKAKKQIEEVGGISYLTEVNDCAVTTAGLQNHLKLIQDKARFRDLIKTGTEILEDAYEEREEIDVLLADATRKILDISSTTFKGTISTLNQYLTEREPYVVPTGLKSIDARLGGIRGITLAGGDTKLNKSTLAHQIGVNWCHQGGNTALWDRENGPQEVSRRLKMAFEKIPDTLFYSSDPRDMTHSALDNLVNKLGRPEKPLLFVGDSIQKIAGTYNRRDEIDSWVRHMELLKLNLPVVFLLISELTYDGHYKESSGLPYTADIVLKIEQSLRGKKPLRKIQIEATRRGLAGHLCTLELPEPWRWKLREVSQETL